ncbi:MAG: PKD domain-containing protein [Candidatus Heimdallarchaeota archaeon]|nr:PKD domain-containing protein [Candidatus Heimdallarchaeota archaeon]
MAITKTAYKGTTGAFFVIALLLGTMVYQNLDLNPLSALDNDAVQASDTEVYVGQEVLFRLSPTILSDVYGIQYFIWDWHDGSYIEYSTREDPVVPHIFYTEGEFLVSVMALQTQNTSRIFSIPISVVSEPQSLVVEATKTSAVEDEIIFFDTKGTGQYTPIVNVVYDWGDGQTSIGHHVNHSYAKQGEYTVRIRGYTNSSIIYTEYMDISISNEVPVATFMMSSETVNEDDLITFTPGIIDGSSDLETMTYIWDFGDGLMTQGDEVTHIYTEDGLYTVTLTAIDDDGAKHNATASIEVLNKVPILHNIWAISDSFKEGQTITSYANVSDSNSDLTFMDFDWNGLGDGFQATQPYFEDGNYSLSLSITDDDGASASASSEEIEITNARPYISLLSATTHPYDLEFYMYGTLGVAANISLFNEETELLRFNITNMDATKNFSRLLYKIENLEQPLNEYWSIFINMNDTLTDFDAFVAVKIILENDEVIDLVNTCSSDSDACVSDSARFPLAALDWGFPSTYEFSLFDPGNDDLTAFLKLGDNEYNTSLSAPEEGYTTGIVTIDGTLPYGVSTNLMTYWVVDEDNAASNIYNVPIKNYALEVRPESYAGESQWEYWGHFVDYFAPVGFFNMIDEFEVDRAYDFQFRANHPDLTKLRYTWNFGSGATSVARIPMYTYRNQGSYLLWVILSDDHYEHVEAMMIETTASISEYTPFVQGVPTTGNALEFMAVGINDSRINYWWDFGDNTTGFGREFIHEYTQPGNYTVTLRVGNQYNMIDYTQFELGIMNAAPTADALSSSVEVVEGNLVSINPKIHDSPYDLLDLQYSWNLGSNAASISIKSDSSITSGRLIVYDRLEANFTYSFSVNITDQPVELSLPRYFIYGDPAADILRMDGTISTNVFEQDTKLGDYSMDWTLRDKQGVILDTGLGDVSTTSFGFSMNVNTSGIGTDLILDSLKEELYSAQAFDAAEKPSGNYPMHIRLLEGTNVVQELSTSIVVTLDKDGDMITDELELLFDNVIEDQTYDYHKKNSNHEDLSDPHAYVIYNDEDGDGLPLFVEDVQGTSDQNPDSDGDGLTDGFGPLGELTHGSDPSRADTDGDALDDGFEVAGWQITLVTTMGLIVKSVTSSPIHKDTDSDGVSDYYENYLGIDPREPDTDFDGLSDLKEQQAGTSLLNKDTDFDGISDADEVLNAYSATYTDAEGVQHEKIFYLSPLNPDSDEDGISDIDEIFKYHSIATSKDSDADGIEDWHEIHTYGTNIIDADSDNDMLADGLEIKGFDIPIVQITNGEYSENGTVLVEPTMTNFTRTVSTNPNNPDSDGDGLSDAVELGYNPTTKTFGDKTDISDPTSIDSDGDGILDPFDEQKLVSDYEPAQIKSIEVKATIQPGTTTKKLVKVFTAGLNVVWDIIKNVSGWVWNLLKSFFWWKEVCVFGICADWPVLHSWSSIVAKTKAAIKSFVSVNLPQIFAGIEEFGNIFMNTLDFSGLSLDLKKVAGIPTGLNVLGTLKLVAEKTWDVITGIVDPMVKFTMDLEDKAGLDKVVIYQDGQHLKTIDNINAKQYKVQEYFKANKNGWFIESTTIKFEIHDIGGNIRYLERTTNMMEFTADLIEQGIHFIIDPVLDVLEDIWNWVTDAAEFLGEVIMDAVDAVVEFVEEIVEIVGDWLMAQFEKIWEAFVRDTVNLLSHAQSYIDRANDYFDMMSDGYELSRSNVKAQMDAIIDPIMSVVNGSLTAFSDLIDVYMPPIDKEAVTEQVEQFFGPLGDTFIGVLEYAWSILGQPALDIVTNVLNKTMTAIYNSAVGPYVQAVVDFVTKLLSGVQLALPVLSFDFGQITEDIVGTVVDIVNLMRNPADLILDLIGGFDSEFILSVIDEVLLDNEDVVISINDIFRTMMTPGVVIGLVAYDLVNWVGDIFSTPNFQIKDVASMKMDTRGSTSQIHHQIKLIKKGDYTNLEKYAAIHQSKTQSTGISLNNDTNTTDPIDPPLLPPVNDTQLPDMNSTLPLNQTTPIDVPDEWYKVIEKIFGVIGFIAKILAGIKDIIFRGIDWADMQDGDRETISILINAVLNIIFSCADDALGIIGDIIGYASGNKNATAKDISATSLSFIGFIIGFIHDLVEAILSIKFIGNDAADKVLTILGIIWDLLSNIVVFVVNIVHFSVFTAIEGTTWHEATSFGLGLLAQAVMTIYAVLHPIGVLGIPKIPTPGNIIVGVIYIVLAVIANLLALVEWVFNLVIFILKWANVIADDLIGFVS